MGSAFLEIKTKGMTPLQVRLSDTKQPSKLAISMPSAPTPLGSKYIIGSHPGVSRSTSSRSLKIRGGRTVATERIISG
jgi:hypothetical protein